MILCLLVYFLFPNITLLYAESRGPSGTPVYPRPQHRRIVSILHLFLLRIFVLVLIPWGHYPKHDLDLAASPSYLSIFLKFHLIRFNDFLGPWLTFSMMSRLSEASLISSLANAIHSIKTTPPRIIASPPTQPRRAAVALVLRVIPPSTYPLPPAGEAPLETISLQDFFELDWVNAPGARAEILFLRRRKADPHAHANGNGAAKGGPKGVGNGNTLQTKKKSVEDHVAFPGGRMEAEDEDSVYTAMRQTWEEVGLDLAERSFTRIGQLDDREITTSLGKRLLMVLTPHVFLQLVPHEQPTDPSPETTLHWIPLSTLISSTPSWSTVDVDISSRLAPKNSVLRNVVQLLVGKMRFDAIVLNDRPSAYGPTKTKRNGYTVLSAANEKYDPKGYSWNNEGEELRLWGLTLGMTMDLISHLKVPFSRDGLEGHVGNEMASMAASMTSVFPRFSYPDVNFWIWVFGRRYRQIIRGWEESIAVGVNDRRINWTGSALQAFYAAVRKALVVVIVLRAIGILAILGLSGWWLFFRP